MQKTPTHRLFVLSFLVAVLLLPLAGNGCSSQNTEEPTQVADQAPPPPSDQAQSEAPAPPPPPPAASRPQTKPRPQRHATQTVPEERPRRIDVPAAPPEPTTVEVTIPKGTALAVTLGQEISSGTVAVGQPVEGQLKNPVIVGDRVIFPAGSRVQGKVTDVKSAKKGFKDTGGALSVSFYRIAAPDGHGAGIVAGVTKVAEGSGKKKGAIIGGSAAGGLLLGRILGKDGAGSAIVGGAIGTAVAAGTKGKEAVIGADEELHLALEQPATTTIRR